MKYLDIILSSGKTIFTYTDIQILLGITNKDTIKSFFVRGIKAGIFVNIHKGLYGLQQYDLYELGTRLKKNSYISFETVLKKEGVVFQDYRSTVFIATDQTLSKTIGDTIFTYLKLKNNILTHPLGIINTGKYMIASKERAICDRLYLSPGYYFDDLSHIHKDKLLAIAKLYNKRVLLEVNRLIAYA